MPEKTYKVVGAQNIKQTPPGESFTAELDEAQEARLLARGQIEITSGEAPAQPQAPASPPAAPAAVKQPATAVPNPSERR